MFTRRRQNVAVPEVGEEAPEFNLPSAQGGQLRLGMRTVCGPVVVVFFRGAWSEEDVAYFEALSQKEDEINHAGASVVGIGAVEPDEAREFARASGIKSYVLYDYFRTATRQWGLLERDKEHGEYARPAVFIVGTDHKLIHAWADERPQAEEIMAKITEITGLPKPEEEPEGEHPQGATEGAEKPKKMSAEERERIKAERRAAREAGKSVKTPRPDKAAQPEQTAASSEASRSQPAPKKMSKEERERIKAERRAARESGKSVKAAQLEQGAASGEAPAASEAPKKMSAEERERIKAERRADREAGRSLKQPTTGQGKAVDAEAGNEDVAASVEATEPPPESAEGAPRDTTREE
jgi:peroxiredoxin